LEHPLPIGFVIRGVNDYFNEIVAVENAFLPSMALNLLSLEARGIEFVNDFQYRFGQYFRTYFLPVVKLKREQYHVTPQFAVNKLLYPER
jgi:hypothetical protein